jgi:hypothetical protein
MSFVVSQASIHSRKTTSGGRMFQVRIHGRGGQGVVTAAELLSVAAFFEDRHSQASAAVRWRYAAISTRLSAVGFSASDRSV